MTGCDTITLKRFKIPFGAVEMTQKLKAHTVLSEVLVFGSAHPHEAAHIICKSRESASLFQLSRHYLQCCAYVCSHTDTKHKDISFLPLLPPSLPSSISSFSLSLPISLSLWKVGLLLCLFKHGQQSFHESSGDPSRGSGSSLDQLWAERKRQWYSDQIRWPIHRCVTVEESNRQYLLTESSIIWKANIWQKT